MPKRFLTAALASLAMGAPRISLSSRALARRRRGEQRGPARHRRDVDAAFGGARRDAPDQRVSAAGLRGDARARFPVLYMPDGGVAEDFVHVAGLVQVLVGNGTMRPHVLVGIENTQRRRDMTGPTENEDDKKIAPKVGGSEAFRKFIREELMPEVRRRYRTTDATAIVGESLAGLFVVETFLLEPDACSTPTSPSTPACGGTTKPCSVPPVRSCAPRRRARSACGSRAAMRKASSRPPRNSPRPWPRTRHPASAGTTKSCRRKRTPRSTILPPCEPSARSSRRRRASRAISAVARRTIHLR